MLKSCMEKNVLKLQKKKEENLVKKIADFEKHRRLTLRCPRHTSSQLV